MHARAGTGPAACPHGRRAAASKENPLSKPKGSRYPKDRQGLWAFSVIAFALGACAFAASRILAHAPEAVEKYYAGGVWPAFSRPFSRLTGVVPFSLAEALLFAYVLWTVAAVLLALRNVVTRRRRAGNALAGGVRRVLGHSGVFAFLFYVLWGFNYARPPFEVRQGWPAWEGASRAELAELAGQAVAASNDLYLELHGKADAGEPTAVPEDTAPLERALDEGWARAIELLSLDARLAGPFGHAKRPLSSELIARLGITGIYSPFTAEANVLRGVPAMRLPHTMAHEKAHQRGITSEADASFVGFTAAALSPDPLARYAAAMFAASQLLTTLAAADPEAHARIAASRLAGTRRDLADLAVWINRFNGVADRVATAVNDRYLRVNRVPGGVTNYGRSVRLLIEYARHNDGRVMPWRGQ